MSEDNEARKVEPTYRGNESIAKRFLDEISGGVDRVLSNEVSERAGKIESNLHMLVYREMEPKIRRFVETWERDFRDTRGGWKRDFKKLMKTWGQCFGRLSAGVRERLDETWSELIRYESNLSNYVERELEGLRNEHIEAVSALQTRVEELEENSVSESDLDAEMERKVEFTLDVTQTEIRKFRKEVVDFFSNFSEEQEEAVNELVKGLVEDELVKHGIVGEGIMVPLSKPEIKPFFDPTRGTGSVVPSEEVASAAKMDGITVEPADYLLEDSEKPEEPKK